MRNGLLTVAAITLGSALLPAAAQATVSITPANLMRPEAAGTATFTVTRDGLPLSSVTVTVTLGPTGSAICTADVTPCTRSVVLGIGASSGTVTFDLVPDTLDEDDETIEARVTAAMGDTPSPTPATLTIVDDDLPPSLSVASAASRAEGSSGTTAASLPVTLSAPSGRPVSATYAVTAGTAGAGDVTLGSGTVTVPAGLTTADIPLAIAADAVDELDETFTVTLSAPNPAETTITNASSTVTVVDDDLAELAVSPATVREGTGGEPPVARFLVGLTVPSDRPVATTFATSSGSATSGVDFAETGGRVTFAPGETLKTFDVPVVPDAVDEPDETFGVTLSDAGPTPLSTPTNTGTITDDDLPPVQPSANVSFPGLGSSGAGTIPGAGGTDNVAPTARITRLTFQRPNLLAATVTCPAPETACTVQLTVFTAPLPRSKVPALRRERRLVSVRARIPGGGSVVVRARVSKANVTLLRKAKRKVGVRSFAVVRDASGNVGTATRAGSFRF